MKQYEKPMILENEELAEGVYMASGDVEGGDDTSGDCWTVDGRSVQNWNGSEHVFEIGITHQTGNQHISTVCGMQLVFNTTVSEARSEGAATVDRISGNTVYVTRGNHANAYATGDRATFKVFIKCGDEASTKAVAYVGGSGTYCDHQPNVQGGHD